MAARKLLLKYHAEISELAERYGVVRLEAFGSSARGSDTAQSDVDLLVEFTPAPPSVYADRYFALQEALESALGRDVELTEIKQINNPYFLKSIERDRLLLYGSRS